MTRRKHSQLLITELVLFGMAMPSPSELLDPDLRKLDEVLDDEEILAPVVASLRTRRPGSKSRGRPSTPAEVVLRLLTQGRAKLISIFEPTAQILRRGKVHKPTEFGRLVKVQEAEGGIVTDIDVVDNVHDSALLVPSVEQHIRVFGRPPEIVATDRGFYSGHGVRKLQELGIERPVIPKPGRLSNKRREHERQPWFRRGRAWRSGGEARISRLKHPFGMQRARYKGDAG